VSGGFERDPMLRFLHGVACAPIQEITGASP
jgi:hypothetical protein